MTLNWASIVSTGAVWPITRVDQKELVSQHDPADVILIGVEDALDDTVAPHVSLQQEPIELVFTQ